MYDLYRNPYSPRTAPDIPFLTKVCPGVNEKRPRLHFIVILFKSIRLPRITVQTATRLFIFSTVE
jgi:hypothetical protein